MLIIILLIIVIFLMGVGICFLGHIWDTLEDVLTALRGQEQQADADAKFYKKEGKLTKQLGDRRGKGE